MIDYLIIGQGLAGTLLAHFLLQWNKNILIIDDDDPHASSKIAAGIINPVTGRRYVKSWMIEDLLPKAESTYRQMETQLGIPLYHQRSIIWALSNNGEENDWQVRVQDPEYGVYIRDKVDMDLYQGTINPAFSYGEVRHAAQVNVPALIAAYRNLWQEKGFLRKEPFDYSQLTPGEKFTTYRDIKATKVIFCEGSKAQKNPFFAYLPFWASKGEALTVEIPHADLEKLIKQGIYIVPLGEDKYWIGATNDRSFEDNLPTNAGATYLIHRLREVLKIPFRVLEHHAAIRPTVKDRRPFLGKHPIWPTLFIFNGLGGKGASLGPYWGEKLVAHLEDKAPLDSRVNIERYRSEWKP